VGKPEVNGPELGYTPDLPHHYSCVGHVRNVRGRGGLQKKKKNHSYLRGYLTSSSPAHTLSNMSNMSNFPTLQAWLQAS
jgi:hypothetical protein